MGETKLDFIEIVNILSPVSSSHSEGDASAGLYPVEVAGCPGKTYQAPSLPGPPVINIKSPAFISTSQPKADPKLVTPICMKVPFSTKYRGPPDQEQ